MELNGRRGCEIHTEARGERKSELGAILVGSPAESFANVSRIAHANRAREGNPPFPSPIKVLNRNEISCRKAANGDSLQNP